MKDVENAKLNIENEKIIALIKQKYRASKN